MILFQLLLLQQELFLLPLMRLMMSTRMQLHHFPLYLKMVEAEVAIITNIKVVAV